MPLDPVPEPIRLSGELNAVTSPALRERILTMLEEGAHAVLVDLTAVTFIDSSGLGALVGGLKSAKLHGSRLALFGLQEQARQVFQITQAESLFDIAASEEAALALLQRAG